jgi:putative nucleotidyltransferase with HDIG domain
MRQLLREPVLLLAGTIAIVPPAVLHFLASAPASFSGATHFLSTSLSAGAATFAAIALTIAGVRRQDGRTVAIATAFTVMASLLVVHGVASPGVLVESNGVVKFSGAATLPVGAVLLALCTLPGLRSRRAIRPMLAAQVALMLGVIALGAVGMLIPSSVPSVPQAGSTPALITLAAGLAFYWLIGWRAARTFRLTRRVSDFFVLTGVVWLAAALFAAMLLSYRDLGWWIGHFMEVLGIAAIGVPVALDLRRAAQSRALVGDLRAAELVTQEEAFLGAQVRALMVKLAEKDCSTEEHTRRVATRAVQVGEELGLTPARLRVLAVGGLLHDMGKLGVPDAILCKPAALTDEEFEEIKRHPELGDRLLAELGFRANVRRIVRDHHERLDGTGYPNGATEAELALETRIVAVCDVYDALVSDRVYREAWSPERALALLHSEAGTKLDARCVEALERVLAAEQAEVVHLPTPAWQPAPLARPA